MYGTVGRLARHVERDADRILVEHEPHGLQRLDDLQPQRSGAEVLHVRAQAARHTHVVLTAVVAQAHETVEHVVVGVQADVRRERDRAGLVGGTHVVAVVPARVAPGDRRERVGHLMERILVEPKQHADSLTPEPHASRALAMHYLDTESSLTTGDAMGTMTADFAGDVALVTGAAGGMGRAIALAFAAAGATVVMGDVDDAGGQRDRTPRRGGGRQSATSCRPTSPTPIRSRRWSRTAVDRYGGLHCAVNAAAIENETAPLHECDDRHVRSDAGRQRARRVPVDEARDRGDARQRLRDGATAAARSSTSPRPTRSVHSTTSRRTRRRSTPCSG